MLRSRMWRGVQRSISSRLPEDKPASIEWRMAVLIIVFSCMVVLGLFWQTVQTMVNMWSRSRTFAHGFLILPACLYLIWCYRDRLVAVVPRPSAKGFLVLVVVGGGWLFGHWTNMLLVQQAALVAMLPGLVWATLGTSVLRALLFPLGFLVFALPIGTSVEPWLQSLTTAFVVFCLQLIGIPFSWEGYFITLSSGTWQIAPDCAGLRYVLPGLALGYLYVAVLYRGWVHRLYFLFLCVTLLILANGVRAYGIILGDHLGFAEGTDHRIFSYTIYGITMFSLFWFGLKWKEPEHQEILSERAREGDRRFPVRETAFMALGALALLALAPISAWILGDPR